MNRMLFALIATASLAGSALAADTPPAGRQGWNRPDFAALRAKMAARRADDIALLIGLRADQRPALDTFLAAIEPPHRGRDMGEREQGGPPEGMVPPGEADAGTLARLDRMAAMLDRKDGEAKQKIAATRQFYASLTPDQQRRFDALDRLHHDHMRGGHMGGGMMRHGGPGGGPAPRG